MVAARTNTFKDDALGSHLQDKHPQVFCPLKCGPLGQCQPSSMSPSDPRCPVQTFIRVPSSREPRLCPVVNLQQGGVTHCVITRPPGTEGANTSSISPTGHLPWELDRCAINICLAGWGWLGSGMEPKEVSDLREGKEDTREV